MTYKPTGYDCGPDDPSSAAAAGDDDPSATGSGYSRIRVFLNGDRHFYGKTIVVNRRQIRSWEQFLRVATEDVANAAGLVQVVRRLATPEHGTRVRGLDELKNLRAYVAITTGPFQPLKYVDAVSE